MVEFRRLWVRGSIFKFPNTEISPALRTFRKRMNISKWLTLLLQCRPRDSVEKKKTLENAKMLAPKNCSSPSNSRIEKTPIFRSANVWRN